MNTYKKRCYSEWAAVAMRIEIEMPKELEESMEKMSHVDWGKELRRLLEMRLKALWKHHKLLGELDEDAYYGAVKDALRLWEVLEVHEWEDWHHGPVV